MRRGGKVRLSCRPLAGKLTAFGFKVGYAVHDDMMQEEWLVVDLDVSGQEAVEVLHIPADIPWASSVCPKAPISSPVSTHSRWWFYMGSVL